MIITKTCNTCEHFPNDKCCIGCEWDESKRENSKWELKENPVVIERAVLDKIKGYVDYIRNTGMGKKKSLEFIEKFIEGLKAESEK